MINHSLRKTLLFGITGASVLTFLATTFANWWGGAIALLVSAGVAMAFTRHFSRWFSQVGDWVQEFDHEQPFPRTHLAETKQFAQTLSETVQGCQESFCVRQDPGICSRTAREMQQSCETMTQRVEALQQQANNLTQMAQQLNERMEEVAVSTQQSMSTANTASTASEGLLTSVAEIVTNTETARSVTTEAVHRVEGASHQIGLLKTSAEDITKVLDMIVEISGQTKLLALNATIEAARAGEAGKGFAVVASEVKELAHQTNAATAEIQTKIDAMQHSTLMTIQEIEAIDHIIRDVDSAIVNIATAVEEQAMTNYQVGTHITDSATGFETVLGSIGEHRGLVASFVRELDGFQEETVSITHAKAELERQMSGMLAKSGTVLS